MTNAQSTTEKEVASAVEALRVAMVDGDKAALEKLAAAELSYGHSSGRIEDKATFVKTLTSGESNFTEITLSEQTIQVIDKTALVRHTLFAHTNDAGKGPATVNLGVLLVWIQQNDGWKLVGRQAFKL